MNAAAWRKVPRNIYEVCFWQGGSEVGEWYRTVPRFEGRDLAISSTIASEILRQGYVVKILNTRDIERHGLPDTRD